MLFGSELFEEYIGQLAMASMASLDMFTEGEQFDAKKLQEKMRVNHFTCFLNTQLYWNNKFYLERMLKVLALVAFCKYLFTAGCSKGERGKACRTTKK
jgi:hypothetical protein